MATHFMSVSDSRISLDSLGHGDGFFIPSEATSKKIGKYFFVRKFSRGPWEAPGVPWEAHGKILKKIKILIVFSWIFLYFSLKS